MDLYFSDVFEVSVKSLDDYGAFNISLLTDLPLFIDPFLLFHSKKTNYQQLHDDIIKYLEFLRDKSISQAVNEGLLRSWFHFSEVKQSWLGFSLQGNAGRGLGREFALALNNNLYSIFTLFGQEKITKGTHLEKLCLIKRGVGRDTISDFTTNLIKEYLLQYTQSFTEKYIDPKHTVKKHVGRVRFNYNTERWESDVFNLPFYKGDFVILTPKDIMTKDDIWINRNDFLNDFNQIVDAVPNQQLRSDLDNYLISVLSPKPKKEEWDKAITTFAMQHPELIDYYIKAKEDNGDDAAERSRSKVTNSKTLYIEQFGDLIRYLYNNTLFYKLAGDTSIEAYQRIQFLKDVIENKGGWRVFYIDEKPIRREEDLHIFYRLTWYATVSDVSREVNDGRGSADFKISRGSQDKTIVEFKLASNPQLKQNLRHQVELYKKASDANVGYKVIVFFTDVELQKVQDILRELDLFNSKEVILIDARKKLSASKVATE